MQSSSLFWQQVTPSGNRLSRQLKFIFREYLKQDSVDMSFASGDIAPLRAILAATTNEEVKVSVNEMILAIEQFGRIRVWEDFESE